MRIALDIRTIHPNFPGIGRYALNLARSLPQCLGPSDRLALVGNETGRISIESVLEYPQCQYLKLPTGPFSLRQTWQIPRFLRRMEADVFHTPFLPVPVHPLAALVLTVQDLIPVRLPELVSRRARRLWPTSMRWVLPRAREIIVPSRFSKKDLVNWLGDRVPRITVIPHAAEERFHHVDQQEAARVRKKYGLTDYLLTLASNRPHKNLDRLVDAHGSANCKLPLVIAGAGHAPMPEDSREQIIQLGRIDETDLPGLYAGARLFVFASLYEGFGLPVLEALAAGTPVICSGNTALPEVAGSAALYFEPHDVGQIKDCLEAVLGDPAKLDALAQQAKTQALRFDWTSSARATVEVYRIAGSLARSQSG